MVVVGGCVVLVVGFLVVVVDVVVVVIVVVALSLWLVGVAALLGCCWSVSVALVTLGRCFGVLRGLGGLFGGSWTCPWGLLGVSGVSLGLLGWPAGA